MNDHNLKDVFHISDTQNLTIDIPHSYFEEEIQRITFDLPDAISPRDLGVSADGRTLGIAVRMLSIDYPLEKAWPRWLWSYVVLRKIAKSKL